MQLVEFDQLASLAPDVCVIGAGPAGLAVASGLARQGVRVLVLECGTDRPEPQAALAHDEVVGPHHAKLQVAIASGLGGTSAWWGGRCVPMDPLDLKGDWAQVGAWPLLYDDVSPYFEAAAKFLGCGEAMFEDSARPDDPSDACGINLRSLERWCDEPRLAARLAEVSPADGMFLCLGARVIGGVVSMDDQKLENVRLQAAAAEISLAAPTFVIAAGGLETTRLLLSLQARHPELFGGPDGPLGRYYMGHLSGSIAEIEFSHRKFAGLFRYRYQSSSAVRRRLTLTPRVLAENQLPNIAFYPDNPRLADARHGEGVLSALYLLLATPSLGRRLVADAILGMQLRDASSKADHLRNMLVGLPRTLAVLIDLAWQRIVKRRRKPALFLQHRGTTYPLHFHAEHRPQSDSRVTLRTIGGATVPAPLRIDLRFSWQDAVGVVRAHEELDRRMQAAGLGRLRFQAGTEDCIHAVLRQAQDGYHQIGLARMGQDRFEAVVDSDCRTFDLSNLYLAGSAVFRTSGQANPTFFATALALRLANHLVGRRRASSIVQ